MKLLSLRFCSILAAGIFFSTSLYAAEAAKFTSLSLEELMNTEVTSVTRSIRPLSQSAAAVTVITEEDIRRSGATAVPELFRMVPGMQVARITASQWAVSIRGFNSSLVTKLLVLVDGRTVYSPLHSGVYWDVQDLPLEIVERIEVIRGPGASVWGSNAMNGVINILTKKAKDTQGGLATGGLGTEQQDGSLRYGGKMNEKTFYRGYGRFFNRDSSFQGNDAWQMGQGGIRVDSELDEKNKLSFDGAYYNGEEDIRSTMTSQDAPFSEPLFADGALGGGHLLGRWEHTYSETSDSTLQIYYDQTHRDSVILDEIRYAGDIDWRHRFAIGERHEVVWGLGYRLNADKTKGTFTADFRPGSRVDNLYQFFVQDTVSLIQDKLWFTGGSRFEVNDYSGFEVQPTARLLWQPTQKQSIWGAVSRAVRIPSRVDHDLRIQVWSVPGTTLLRVEGDHDRESENLWAYELGYRVQPHKQFSIDVTGFINDYDNLTTLRLLGGNNPENGYMVTRYAIDDDMKGQAVGMEISTKTQVFDRLLINSGYTLLQIYLNAVADPFGTAEAPEGQSPEHQIFVNPRLDLPFDLELDASLRYVDALQRSRVPSYWEMDLRLGWRPHERFEISVVGQNLFYNHHLEFPSTGNSEQERAVYGKTAVKF